MKRIFFLSIIYCTFYTTYSFSQTNTWTGAVSTDWHTGCNWSTGVVPTCLDHVVIPCCTSNKAVITGNADCLDIDLQTTGANLLTIVNGGLLQVETCPQPATINSSGVSCGAQVFACTNLDAGVQVSAATTQTAGKKWCYNDVAANCTTYGGLYQWTTAVGISNAFLSSAYGTPASMTCDPCGNSGTQGICPAGYHVPTDLEWSRWEYCIESTIAPTGATTLATFQTTTGARGSTLATAGVYQGPGAKLKAVGAFGDGASSNNLSGFAMLPAGYYADGTATFNFLGSYAEFWTATESDATDAWQRQLFSNFVQVSRLFFGSKPAGYSVRCLQN